MNNATIATALSKPIEEQSLDELRATVRHLIATVELLQVRSGRLVGVPPGAKRRVGVLRMVDERGLARLEIEHGDQPLRIRESGDGGKSWHDLPLGLTFWSRLKNVIDRAWPPREILDGCYFGNDRLELVVRSRVVSDEKRAIQFVATFSRRSGRWSISLWTEADRFPDA